MRLPRTWHYIRRFGLRYLVECREITLARRAGIASKLFRQRMHRRAHNARKNAANYTAWKKRDEEISAVYNSRIARTTSKQFVKMVQIHTK